MEIPILKTERLCVTIPDIDFAPHVARYFEKNRLFHAPWDPIRPENYFSVPFWEKQLEIHRKEFARGTFAYFLLIKEEQQVIGHCNFSNIIRGAFQCCNLGFSVDQDCEGSGYMREALTISIHYVFTKLNLHRIQANHLPHNYRSRNLLRKLGFVVEGYAQDYLFIAGKWQDHILNSLTNPDWLNKNKLV